MIRPPENNKKSNCVRGNRWVPHVRPSCPGVPRGVRGPKTTGEAPTTVFLSESLLVSLVGAPCFSSGSWTVHLLEMGFSPGFSSRCESALSLRPGREAIHLGSDG